MLAGIFLSACLCDRIVLLMWRRAGRLAKTAADTPANSPARSYCIVSFIVSDCLLIVDFTVKTSISVLDGWLISCLHESIHYIQFLKGSL